MEITSLSNKKVKEWTSLQKKKYRDESSSFLIEGEHLVEEALKQGIVQSLILQIGIEDSYQFPDTYTVTEEIMKKISTNVSIPKVVAVCHYFDLEKTDKKHFILLDGLQDPGNIGTIIRTAVSFGFDEVVLSSLAVDRYNDKLIRSTQGAIFQIPVVQMDLNAYIQKLKELGVEIYVTSLQDAQDLTTVKSSGSYALVFGSEGSGVSEEIRQLSNQQIRISMSGFESLNVAVAAGIVMYHFSQF